MHGRLVLVRTRLHPAAHPGRWEEPDPVVTVVAVVHVRSSGAALWGARASELPSPFPLLRACALRCL